MLKDFVAIDLETTGLFPVDKQQVIEYGAVRFVGGVPVERFQQFVRIGRRLPSVIVEITGITDKILEEGGVSELEAFDRFRGFVGDRPLVAHNMGFDFSFIDYLSRLYYKEILGNELFCTLKLARGLSLPVANRKLGTLSAYFDLPEERAHRAVGDALTAGRLFLCLEELVERLEAAEPEL